MNKKRINTENKINWPRAHDVDVNALRLPPQTLSAAKKVLGNDFKNPEIVKKKKKKKDYNNEGWEQVACMHVACGDLLRSSVTITPLLHVRELLKHVVNPKLLTRNIAAITRDTTTLAKELVSIRKYADDRRANCHNQGDAMSAAQTLFTHYVNFMERFDSALFPLIKHASEQLQEALNEYAKIAPDEARRLTANMTQVINGIGSIVRETIGATEPEQAVA